MHPVVKHPATWFCLPALVLVSGLALDTVPWAPSWDHAIVNTVCLAALLTLPVTVALVVRHGWRPHRPRWCFMVAFVVPFVAFWAACAVLTLVLVGRAPFAQYDTVTLAAPDYPTEFFVRRYSCFMGDPPGDCPEYRVEIYRRLPLLPVGRKVLDCDCLLPDQPRQGPFIVLRTMDQRAVRVDLATRRVDYLQ